MILGKRKNGGHAPLPLTESGLALVTETNVVVTKIIEAEATAGSTLLSALAWFGGTLSSPASVFVEAGNGNTGSIKIGAISGSGGISLGAGESAEITLLDPALTEIRVGVGDTASLVAQVPA